MPQSLAKIAIHIVDSTKGRQPWLHSVPLRNDLYAYKATILRDKVDSPAIVIGGMPDHIHVLCLLSRKFPIMSVIEESKTETSKWLKKQSPDLATFAWQGGYGAFSVSESNIPQVRKYIEEQEQHHHRMTFQEEFRALCHRHGLELDERYAWD